MKKLILTILVICIASEHGYAAVYTVTNNNDAGNGSLREAITLSNALPKGKDVIQFNIPSNDLILLNSLLPDITDTLIISGSNMNTGNKIILDGQSQYPIMNTNDPLELNNLEFQNSNSPGSFSALSIYNSSTDTISITSCNFRDNTSLSSGGAILNANGSGVLKISNCNFISNHSNSSGGAIHFPSNTFTKTYLTITDCVFDDNSSVNPGAAIWSNDSTIVTNTLFENNNSSNVGGAVYHTFKVLDISSCTFDNNIGFNGHAISANGKKLNISTTSFTSNGVNNAIKVDGNLTIASISGICNFGTDQDIIIREISSACVQLDPTFENTGVNFEIRKI